MALTEQQYHFISKYLNIDLPDVTFIADGATRTPGEPASAVVDALIDPPLRAPEEGLRSGGLAEVATLRGELDNLPVPPGATAEEASAMNAQRDVIKTAIREGDPSQAYLRAAATALDQLVKLQDAFLARLVHDAAAVLTGAQNDHDTMDPEADQAGQDSVSNGLQAVRDALTTPPTQAGIDAARLVAATLNATVQQVNATTEAARVQRREAAAKFRGQVPKTPEGAIEAETELLAKYRQAILDLLPDLPSREQLADVPEMIRAMAEEVARVTEAIADRKRRADKSREHSATLDAIKSDDRISAAEAQTVDDQRQAIMALLVDLPTDKQLEDAKVALDVLTQLIAGLAAKVVERGQRIEKAQALMDATQWGAGDWVPNAHAPASRVTPIHDEVARCVVALTALTDWSTAHNVADDAGLDALREELDKQKLALGTLNTEVTEAYAAFDQAVATAKQAIDTLALSAEQKAAFVEQVETARTSGDDGFDGLEIRSNAVKAVPVAAKDIADQLGPLTRRLAAVPLTPAGALPAELKELKDLHDAIDKALGTVTAA